MTPRRILAEEWAELRDIRLRLLSDVPWRAQALVVERTLLREDWEERAGIGATAQNRAAFIVEGVETWVGIVEAAVADDPAAAEIEGFWVSPEQRRRGLGAALLGAAGAWAADGGLSRLDSWVREQNEPAIAAHARAGFVPTGEVERWPVRSDWQIRMVRDLP